MRLAKRQTDQADGRQTNKKLLVVDHTGAYCISTATAALLHNLNGISTN